MTIVIIDIIEQYFLYFLKNWLIREISKFRERIYPISLEEIMVGHSEYETFGISYDEALQGTRNPSLTLQ